MTRNNSDITTSSKTSYNFECQWPMLKKAVSFRAGVIYSLPNKASLVFHEGMSVRRFQVAKVRELDCRRFPEVASRSSTSLGSKDRDGRTERATSTPVILPTQPRFGHS